MINYPTHTHTHKNNQIKPIIVKANLNHYHHLYRGWLVALRHFTTFYYFIMKVIMMLNILCERMNAMGLDQNEKERVVFLIYILF